MLASIQEADHCPATCGCQSALCMVHRHHKLPKATCNLTKRPSWWSHSKRASWEKHLIWSLGLSLRCLKFSLLVLLPTALGFFIFASSLTTPLVCVLSSIDWFVAEVCRLCHDMSIGYLALFSLRPGWFIFLFVLCPEKHLNSGTTFQLLAWMLLCCLPAWNWNFSTDWKLRAKRTWALEAWVSLM